MTYIVSTCTTFVFPLVPCLANKMVELVTDVSNSPTCLLNIYSQQNRGLFITIGCEAQSIEDSMCAAQQ